VETPSGIEVSPETVTRERLDVCRTMGVDRVSMGVQSFSEQEVRALARPQQNAVVVSAVEAIRRAGFPVLNLDLIYGIAGQTLSSWGSSLDSALALAPEEIYLYPLYVRERTGLGKLAIRRAADPADERTAMYAMARERLVAAGYTQVSMRMFRAPHAPDDDGPVYCCQTDGMVGLGAGARSYTSRLHYSTRYAVDRVATREIVERFAASDTAQFGWVDYGFELDGEEQRRRFAIQSLLSQPGLVSADYTRRFGSVWADDLPQLNELAGLKLARDDGRLLSLTTEGLALADTIGPWLASDGVVRRMAGGC
jgi:oxygen-independent coproporphyrinogen III oxidase